MNFRAAFAFVIALCAVSLTGCGFLDKTSSSSTSSTGNYLYVANAGSNSVSGFQIATAGTLTASTGSPFTVPVVPTALAVSISNKYVYAGTVSGIYGYTIGSTGTLSTIANGAVLQPSPVRALTVSPDGQWLLEASSDGATITSFLINSDGTLSVGSTVFYTGFTGTATVLPSSIHVSPNGAYVYATLGAAGTMFYAFNTTYGTLTNGTLYFTASTTTGDADLAINAATTYLYLARTGTPSSLTTFSIGTGGVLTAINSYSTGGTPASVTMDTAGKYVYTANSKDSTISGFVIGSNGTLTSIAGSPFSAGLGVGSLAADKTGSWILAAAPSGAPYVSMYGFDAVNAGRLFSVTTATAGNTPSIVAVSH